MSNYGCLVDFIFGISVRCDEVSVVEVRKIYIRYIFFLEILVVIYNG